MDKLNSRETIEFFHLIFLEHCGRKLDKKLYALKGGCNLRFYFNSIRYSEDIDFDVQIIAKHTLENKINQILTGTPLKQALKIKKIEITHLSAPKQTDTTQRWKIQLMTQGTALPISTKIEFSRRKIITGASFEFLQSNILQNYRLMPIIANHYNFQNAVEQKIEALAFRTQTQARDIFDIFQLSLGTPIHFILKTKKWQETLNEARLKAKTISFQDFKDQVVEFLPDDYRSQYESAITWKKIQKTLDSLLEKVSHATS